MHGDQLGAIRKGCFHLNVGNHFCNTVHDICTCEQGATFAHELGYGFAIACTFHDGCTDVGHSFWVIQLKATGFSALGQEPCCEYEEFVFFAWGEFHGALV